MSPVDDHARVHDSLTVQFTLRLHVTVDGICLCCCFCVDHNSPIFTVPRYRYGPALLFGHIISKQRTRKMKMLSSPAAPHAYVGTMTPARKRSQPPMYHIPLSAGMSSVLKRNRPAGTDACTTTRHLSLLLPAQCTAVDTHLSAVRPCSLVDATMSAGERRHIHVRGRTSVHPHN